MFFAGCALAFGNHLSTVLLVPGFVLFLCFAVPRGWKTLFAPRVVATAVRDCRAGDAAVRVELRRPVARRDPAPLA